MMNNNSKTENNFFLNKRLFFPCTINAFVVCGEPHQGSHIEVIHSGETHQGSSIEVIHSGKTHQGSLTEVIHF